MNEDNFGILNNTLDNLNANMDNMDWLSKALGSLSSLLIHTSTDISWAQFEENAVALKYLDSAGGKKVSVAEADKRAIQETSNKYKQFTLQREGVIEMIQAIRTRLDYLSIKIKGQNNE